MAKAVKEYLIGMHVVGLSGATGRSWGVGDGGPHGIFPRCLVPRVAFFCRVLLSRSSVAFFCRFLLSRSSVVFFCRVLLSFSSVAFFCCFSLSFNIRFSSFLYLFYT